MTSTFFGLETAKRALATQQSALYTTGHNISNANTPGYTRQRVNMQTTLPYPSPSLNRPQIPGQLGTGVKAGDITRIRDSFTDMQFRTESSKLGYWQSKVEMLSQMENIMNEPSDIGLANTMNQFWNALQDLAVQPQNDGARRVVRERGITLADTFNYMANSLKTIQADYRKEIETSQDSINSILRQINAINKEIGSIEPHGYLPNDLYDERDRLLDELSTYMNIRVDSKSSGGLASANAEGKLDVYLATPEGDILKDSNGKPIKLVDATMGIATGIHIQFENRSEIDSPMTQIKFFQLNENDSGFAGMANNTVADQSTNPRYILEDFNAFKSNGALKGYIEGFGYKIGDEVKGKYNDMLADLDQMAYTFATHFNLVHGSGWSLNEIENGAQNDTFGDFFAIGTSVKGAASRIAVASHIIDDVKNIAAAAEGNVIAGAMKRENANNKAVGNPSFTGIYDSADSSLLTITDSTGATVTWPAGLDNINVKVEYDSDVDPSIWNYTFTAVDADGNTFTATHSTSDKTVKLFGINFDTSSLSSLTDGDTWSLTFKAEGVKSTDEAFIGNGSNALALANVKDALIDFGGNLTNVQSFYQGMIGKLGDNASEANRMAITALTLKGSVEQRRMSESSVSLDEEMVNMIQYQHAYNAAARQVTLIDELLDKVINGMGIVGR
ncbi:hypothetical protein J27TS8_40690 [Robertmurraya siralis]|uniref:Flagellar hook-associated protein 1 n=1 Tax=Robertmurraya siralis TaxID=77777 RepID=A0A919WL28_9BACI|nr:flagellar hook-associated protein FlgK [Robertmurraya siralis]GIN64076.1 hypothetical protein J27TS8_40690 [Robertmurraya siralis]